MAKADGKRQTTKKSKPARTAAAKKKRNEEKTDKTLKAAMAEEVRMLSIREIT